jgi:hypothetical protein
MDGHAEASIALLLSHDGFLAFHSMFSHDMNEHMRERLR